MGLRTCRPQAGSLETTETHVHQERIRPFAVPAPCAPARPLMSLARTLLRRVAASRARAGAPDVGRRGAGPDAELCLPHARGVAGKSVEQVIVPGAEGEYGVTAGHSPIASQLKPGVLQILHGSGEEPEKFFVSGGFALTHESSVTDISAVEAFKLDDIDPEAVKEIPSSKAKFDASSDEVEKARRSRWRRAGHWPSQSVSRCGGPPPRTGAFGRDVPGTLHDARARGGRFEPGGAKDQRGAMPAGTRGAPCARRPASGARGRRGACVGGSVPCDRAGASRHRRAGGRARGRRVHTAIERWDMPLGLLRHESDTFVIVHLAELVLIAAVVEESGRPLEREPPPNPIW